MTDRDLLLRLPRDIVKQILERSTPDDILRLTDVDDRYSCMVTEIYGLKWYEEETLNRVTAASPSIIGLPLSTYRAAFYGNVDLLLLFASQEFIPALVLAGAVESGYVDIVTDVIRSLSGTENVQAIHRMPSVFVAAGRGGYRVIIDILLREMGTQYNTLDTLMGLLQSSRTRANDNLIIDFVSGLTINPFEDYVNAKQLSGDILPYDNSNSCNLFFTVPTARVPLTENLLLLLCLRPEWESSLVAPRIDVKDPSVSIDYLRTIDISKYHNVIVNAAARINNLSILTYMMETASVTVNLNSTMHPDIILYLLNRGVYLYPDFFGTYLGLSPEIDSWIVNWLRSGIWRSIHAFTASEACFVLNILERKERCELYLKVLDLFIRYEDYRGAEQLPISNTCELSEEIYSRVIRSNSIDLMSVMLPMLEEPRRSALLLNIFEKEETSRDHYALKTIIRRYSGLDLTGLCSIIAQFHECRRISLLDFLFQEGYVTSLPGNIVRTARSVQFIVTCLRHKVVSFEDGLSGLVNRVGLHSFVSLANAVDLPMEIRRRIYELGDTNKSSINPLGINRPDSLILREPFTSLYRKSIAEEIGVTIEAIQPSSSLSTNIINEELTISGEEIIMSTSSTDQSVTTQPSTDVQITVGTSTRERGINNIGSTPTLFELLTRSIQPTNSYPPSNGESQ